MKNIFLISILFLTSCNPTNRRIEKINITNKNLGYAIVVYKEISKAPNEYIIEIPDNGIAFTDFNEPEAGTIGKVFLNNNQLDFPEYLEYHKMKVNQDSIYDLGGGNQSYFDNLNKKKFSCSWHIYGKPNSNRNELRRKVFIIIDSLSKKHQNL